MRCEVQVELVLGAVQIRRLMCALLNMDVVSGAAVRTAIASERRPPIARGGRNDCGGFRGRV